MGCKKVFLNYSAFDKAIWHSIGTEWPTYLVPSAPVFSAVTSML